MDTLLRFLIRQTSFAVFVELKIICEMIALKRANPYMGTVAEPNEKTVNTMFIVATVQTSKHR